MGCQRAGVDTSRTVTMRARAMIRPSDAGTADAKRHLWPSIEGLLDRGFM